MPRTSIVTPSSTSAAPKLCGACARCRTFASYSFWNTWKIVKPKPISDREVRITDISVRSADIRVRWNDIPVRRADKSVEMRFGSEFDVIRGLDMSAACATHRGVHLFQHLIDR